MKINQSEWDSVASHWDMAMQNGDWFQRYIIYPTLLNTLGDLQGKSVLDVGCGNGHLSRYLKKHLATVTGIDRSEEMIKTCKKYCSDILFLVHDITLGELSNQKFDYIIFNNSIQDMKDYIAGIKAASLMLKKGGKLIICVKHPCFHPTDTNAGWVVETDNGDTLVTGSGLTSISQLDCHYTGKHFIMDEYLNHCEHVREWYGEKTVSYSRTVAEYCNTIVQCGLQIVKVEEPMPIEDGQAENPDLYALLVRIPNFIFFTAGK